MEVLGLCSGVVEHGCLGNGASLLAHVSRRKEDANAGGAAKRACGGWLGHGRLDGAAAMVAAGTIPNTTP